MSEDVPVVVEAPAKLTLSLRITGVRGDGYHLLDADMVALDLADVLHVDAGGDGISVDGPFAVGVPTDASNLVAKALLLAGRRAGVRIVKHIPPGGGLGGGSADAGAVLRWAGFDDLVAASRLGADIPFCLVGGRARVTGIGEVLEPLPFEPLEFTLVVPPFGVSTPAVYRAWDEGARSSGVNALEAAAIAVEPRLGQWREWILAACGVAPTLAGSGATWFVRGHPAVLWSLEARGATVVAARTRR